MPRRYLSLVGDGGVSLAVLVSALIAPLAPVTSAYNWESIPKSVRTLQSNLTLTFERRTALLWSTKDGVVGGTGTVDAPLIYVECIEASCFKDWPLHDYIAVVEESLLGTLLPELSKALSPAGSSLEFEPQGVITLPGGPGATFSTASRTPLKEYSPAGATTQWNGKGKDLLELKLPVPVFLATREQADEIRSKAQRNLERGFDGSRYGAKLEAPTSMDLKSNSLQCIKDDHCLPLGGYSVWASMPPMPANLETTRKQIIVISHWDAMGLFRSEISSAHSGMSGLISMLVAADLLSSGLQANTSASFSHDIIFLGLSSESAGLMGSRRLLYEIQQQSNNTKGLDLELVEAIVEVGMTATPASDGQYSFFVHGAANDSAAGNALVQAGSAGPSNVTIARASQVDLPPSSLLLWNLAAPDIDSIYLGDFDSSFNTAFFWSYKDTMNVSFSSEGVALAGLSLAHSLATLANPGLVFPETAASQAIEMADTLAGCLLRPGGLSCKLVQDMMSSFSASAEMRPGVLRAVDADAQFHSATSKSDVERFVWEFLANRTFTGSPQQTKDEDGELSGCNVADLACGDGEVCMHTHSGRSTDVLGMCVRATVRYVPSYSTKLVFVPCDGEDCTDGDGTWEVADDASATAWEKELGLPADPVWTETNNEQITSSVSLREAGHTDYATLTAGIVTTVVAGGTVWAGKFMYARHFKNL